MERVLKVDTKAELLQQANLVGSHTVANLIMVMATMTVHDFPSLPMLIVIKNNTYKAD